MLIFHRRLCCSVLYPGYYLALRLLHPVFGVVGIPVDEPIRPKMSRL